MNIKAMYKNMCQVVEMYGGTPPRPDSPKALDFMSDYMLAIGCELKPVEGETK